MIRSTHTPVTAHDEDSLVLLEALLASAPVGIAFLDGNLCVVRMNEALASAAGCTVEDCTGKSARELAPPALWPMIEPALRRVAERGEAIHDYEFSGRQAGRDDVRHWIASVFPVRARGERLYGVGAVVRDVTGRVRLNIVEGTAKTSASLVAILKDGTRLEESTPLALGNPGNPMSWADMERKFLGLTTPVMGAAATDAFARLRGFSNARDLEAVFAGG